MRKNQHWFRSIKLQFDEKGASLEIATLYHLGFSLCLKGLLHYPPTAFPKISFIFEPDRITPNGITYSWLIHDTYNGKEKAATATRAFWLPFAYHHSGNHSETELRDLAQQSIWQMGAQI